MTCEIGAGSGAVKIDIAPMQGIGILPPLDWMNRKLIAQVTLGAGDFGNPTSEIVSVAISTGQYIFACSNRVAGGHPVAQMGTIRRVEVSLGILVSASGHNNKSQ